MAVSDKQAAALKRWAEGRKGRKGGKPDDGPAAKTKKEPDVAQAAWLRSKQRAPASG